MPWVSLLNDRMALLDAVAVLNEENEELINVLQIENSQLIEKNLKLEIEYNKLLQEANLNNELVKYLIQINYK